MPLDPTFRGQTAICDRLRKPSRYNMAAMWLATVPVSNTSRSAMVVVTQASLNKGGHLEHPARCIARTPFLFLKTPERGRIPIRH